YLIASYAIVSLVLALHAQTKPRARDLGIPFEGQTGPLNAITDVAGVEVGHTTVISGDGPLKVGVGPVRTGVTAILPRGKAAADQPVYAGVFSLNGNGEMTGTAWIEESGFLEGPILLTNTHSVGVVRDAVIAWDINHTTKPGPGALWSLPVVAETYDGYLSDINGFHVKSEHVFHALDTAVSGPVSEGGVGGGTGMICYEFKGGIGTASRKLSADLGGYTTGVLVQANHGTRNQLTVAGVPVGREIGGGRRRFASNNAAAASMGEYGSILIIVATDAPLIPTQLKRLARRASLGLARTGAISGNGSGDLFLAFSTANAGAADGTEKPNSILTLSNDRTTPLFESVVEATEEAIINALVAGETMTGADNHRIEGLPHDRLREILQKYNRLGKVPGEK
ncbi:MAG TPA: P1 family peptidase, partial [Opitutaceae bacterium]|nr:P1 family peptidase [Opitutaceae bacterium]